MNNTADLPIPEKKPLTREDILVELKVLIALTPFWKKDAAGPKGRLMLPNGRPRTIAEAFEKDSNVTHKYNGKDGWSIFADDKYQKVEDEKEIAVYLRRFLSDLRIETEPKEDSETDAVLEVDSETKAVLDTKKENFSFKYFESSPSKVNNLLEEIRSLESVHLKPNDNAPRSITGELDPDRLIALDNGLLDWSKHPYTLHKHTKDFYTFNYLPFDWEGDKDSEMWGRFLNETVNGDVEVFELLQMYIGYCLILNFLGKGYFLLIKGEADTGKSVFVDVITHLFGNENVSAVSLEDFNDKHLMYNAYGKYVNISDESPESFNDKDVENTLKKYTGGTQFHFKAMYRAAFSAYPTAKLIMATNNRPQFSDTSEGVWTRLRYAEFNNVVAAKDQDRQLTQKIIATEMSGVLKWAIAGARKFIANGYKLPIPESSQLAIDEYRMESCPELGFMKENFEDYDVKSMGVPVRCDFFRSCYESWCKNEGIGIRKQKTLKITMGKLFPRYYRKQKRTYNGLKYHYFGISLKRESEYYVEETL